MKTKLFMQAAALVMLLSVAPPISTNGVNHAVTAAIDTAAKTLSISALGDLYGIDDAVRLFNQQHSNAVITVTKYDLRYDAFEEDYERYKQQTTVRLMSGLADDLLDAANLSRVRLSKSGVLAGLYPLMDSDPGYDPDDYYTNVFEGMEYNGELYVFPLDFTYSLTGVNSGLSDKLAVDFGNMPTVSDRELMDFYKAEPDKKGLYVIEGLTPLRTVSNNIDLFIDYDNALCRFDSNRFISMLTDSKAFAMPSGMHTTGFSAGIGAPRPDTEAAGMYFFKSITAGSGYYQYLLSYEEFSGFTEFKPQANDDGKVYFYPRKRFCISEGSPNKELAWEFLKFWTSPEVCDLLWHTEHSVNRTARRNAEAAAAKRAVDELEAHGYFLKGDKQQQITDMLNRLDLFNNLPMISPALEDTVYDIIASVISKFEAGGMSAEIAAANLQSRITIILEE